MKQKIKNILPSKTLYIFLGVFVFLGFFFSEIQNTNSPGFTTVFYNNRAVSKLESIAKAKQKNPKEPISEENLLKAEEDLHQALKIDEKSPSLHFNLGVFLLLKNQAHSALKEWEFSLKKWNSNQLLFKFMTLFNKAFVYGLLKNKEKALSLYQESLEFYPESLEVRTNIELLFQEQNKDSSGGEGEGEGEGTGDPKNSPSPKNSEKELTEKQMKQLLQQVNQQDQKNQEENLKKQQKGSPYDKNW